jgi:hypothetical protein
MINHGGNVVTSAYIEMNSSKDNNKAAAEILHLDIQAPVDDGILLVGDEVKTSYGKFTNIEMLLNYGFCEMNGNPWNRESFYVRTLSHPKPILVTCLDKDGSVDRSPWELYEKGWPRQKNWPWPNVYLDDIPVVVLVLVLVILKQHCRLPPCQWYPFFPSAMKKKHMP